MACSLKESFERSCRICAEEQEVTIMIFSREAEVMLLQNKLIQYLLIEINENDNLPKNICLKCCTKLHTVCEFIDMARKSQEILLSRSVLINPMHTEDTSQESCVEIENVDNVQYFDKETTITQMEISIDPMLLLQSSEGVDITPENDEPASYGDEVSYLHGLEGENVTIKLIRKCDNISGFDRTEAKERDADQKANDIADNFKPFPCIVCRRSFLTELALKNHSWIHSKEVRNTKPLFPCCLCRESFKFKSALLAHIKDHKSNVTCKICGRVFRTEENLSLHTESHDKSTAFTCKICGRAYNTNSNLKMHSITHSNDRPYKCHLCKKSFKRNQDLKFHINQHTGARPYKCPYCDKCFASSGNCYSHRNRMHPGKKEAPGMPLLSTRRRRTQRADVEVTPQTNGLLTAPLKTTVKGITKYKCQICGHGFMKKDNFTYHLFQHTGEKPFQCSLCSEKFVTRRGLTIHHDRSHPLQDRPLSLLSRNVLLS